MSFHDDACLALSTSVAEARQLLNREQYVHRLIYREGEDPRQAYQLYNFLDEHRPQQNNILKDSEVLPNRRIVLIGNAGSGKSLILTRLFVASAERFRSDTLAPIPFFLDLHRELDTNNDLTRALDFKYGGFFSKAIKEHPDGCVLVLDGLDERLLKVSQRFVKDLEFFLQEVSGSLNSLVVACRRAAWNPDWFKALAIRPEVFHADYLADEDYAQIIPEGEARTGFFDSCGNLGITELLDNPFDGFYLARRFAAKQPLPRSRRECLDQRINDSVQRAVESEEIVAPLATLRFWARQLASISMFGGCDSYTLQEAVNALGYSSVLQPTVKTDEIRVLLESPLFKKQGERFGFTHQLYPELLAAESLLPLSLRKQGQLLDAKLPGINRVCTPYRGVAAFLAERSDKYCNYLLRTEPLVLFFAEAPSLSLRDDEILIRRVLDQSIDDHRAPWWELPPRGERPLNVLRKHRPEDIHQFLAPYLQDSRQIAQLWATACAESWGGCVELNQILDRLAHDVSTHQDVRTWAIEAIVKTNDVKSIRDLYDLMAGDDDEVKGLVLEAYRNTEAPSPQEYIRKIGGGSRQRNRLCSLQREVKQFAISLERNRLHDGFTAAQEYFDQIGNLRYIVIGGLFEAANNQDYDAVPAALIERLLNTHDTGHVYYEKSLYELLKKEPIVCNLVTHVTNALENDDAKLNYHEIARLIGTHCNDSILAVLPPSVSGLNRRQMWFLSQIVTGYFNREPTKERLAYFNERIPHFTENLQIPEIKKKEEPRDLLEERRIISDAMNEQDPINCTWRILVGCARIEHGQRYRGVQQKDVQAVLDRLPNPLKNRVLNIFRKCVETINYKKERSQNYQISMTRHEYEIPFWILRAAGDTFVPKTLKNLVTCYGFSGSSEEEEARYKPLLEELRNRHKEIWKACVYELVDDSFLHSPSLVVRYLVELEDPLYLDRCSERLSGGKFSGVDFSDLLFYWRSFRPTNYSETLHACYEHLSSEISIQRQNVARTDTTTNSLAEHDRFQHLAQFRVLLLLLAQDDDWAWQELISRIRVEDLPIDVNLSEVRLPMNPRHLTALADWYGFIRRHLKDDYGGHHNSAGVLLEAIVNIGGEAAVQELRRLQTERAFPNPEWLSHTILRIDDQMLSDAKTSLSAGNLLDFINKAAFGVVSSERDLFEWVCEAIEEIKDSVELRADWVAGFWNGNHPKEEPACQNVLWPSVKEKLMNLGIANIEEKFIGANKCDFWALFPRKDAAPYQVAVELKVARNKYDKAELIDPIEEQLWKKYLNPEKCGYGVYVVLWFKDGKRYRGPKSWKTIQDLARDIDVRSKVVANDHRVSIASYVIDLTTPYRKH
jgi:hypothetical protein